MRRERRQPVPFPPTALLVAPLVAACATMAPSSPGFEPIVIDGRFEDWEGVPVAAWDPADAPGSPVDFREVRLTHDDEAIYFLLDFGRPVTPHALAGTVSILLDVDGDGDTGVEEAGLPGVDLVLELSPPRGKAPEAIATGIRLRRPGAATPEGTGGGGWDSYDVGLLFEPNHVAERVEFRLERRALQKGPRFVGRGFRGKLVFADTAGVVRDETAVFSHDLFVRRTRPPAPGRSGEDPLAKAPAADFRVVAWNVSREAFVERPLIFSQVLAALRPDVLILDEVPPSVTGVWLEGFLSNLPAAAGAGARRAGSRDDPAGGWEYVLGEGGGGQRGVVACPAEVSAVDGLRWIPYPDSLDDFLARLEGRQVLLQTRKEEGVPATGAVVRVRGRRLMALAVDLQCCGDGPESAEDRLRRIEASAIRHALLESLASVEDVEGLIIGGDLNLVGSLRPLELLRDGLDVDGSALSLAHAVQLDGVSAATWDGGAGRFSPGRLDYILYSDAALAVERAFVFDSRDLSPRWLQRHGLRSLTSQLASDHFPVVADFRWRTSRP